MSVNRHLRILGVMVVLVLANVLLNNSVVRADTDEFTVAYFPEWPSPNLAYKANDKFSEVLGVKVNWRAFADGNGMSAAMALGEVQIAYAQGVVPFIVAASNGISIKLVGVAMSYAKNDNCVVKKGSGISKSNAKLLEGRKIATPIGTVTHYKLLRTLKHLGVDTSAVYFERTTSSEGVTALERGDVVMACAFGGPLQRMKEFGDVLMTAEEQEAIGIRVFDVISVTEKFAEENPELIVKFLQLTEDVNRGFVKKPDMLLPTIAAQSGLSVEDTHEMINLIEFPSKDVQLSEKWLGGGVQKFMKDVAEFYVDQGHVSEMPEDLEAMIDPGFMKQIK